MIAVSINSQILDLMPFGSGFKVCYRLDIALPDTFADKKISFAPHLFLPIGYAPTLPCTSGYNFSTSVTLPTGVNDMNLFGTNASSHANYKATIEFINPNEAEICISGLLTTDLNQPFGASSIDAVSHLNTYIIGGGLFDNSIANFYNSPRIMRADFCVNSFTFDDETSIDITAQGIPLCQGGTWNWYLERGGEEVENLSSFEPTCLIYSITHPTYTFGPFLPEFTIYKESVTATGDYVAATDLFSLNPIENITPTGLTIPYLSAVLVSAVGTTRTYKIELNPAYLILGCRYRIFPIVDYGSGEIYSCYTDKYLVVDAPPPSTKPDFTSYFETYNDTHSTNCINARSPQRIKACFNIDKAAYDAALVANGITSDFDSAFQQVTTTAEIGGVTVDLSGTAYLDQDGFKYCYEFLILPEWIGQTIDICHSVFFQLFLDLSYTDQINFKQRVNVLDYENVSTAPVLESITYADENGDPLTGICNNGEVTVCVTKVAGSNDFNFIPFVGISEPEEYDSFLSNYLNQVNSGIIISSDESFVDDKAQFVIDASKLIPNEDYCIWGLALPITQPPCPTLELTLATAGINDPMSPQVNTAFFIVTDPLDSVSSVTMTVENKTGTGSDTQTFVTDTGFIDIILPPSTSYRVQVTITITTANGCTYAFQDCCNGFLNNVPPTPPKIFTLDAD